MGQKRKMQLSLESWCAQHGFSFLLNEWDYHKNLKLTPKNVSYASNKKVWWICPNGHEYGAKIGNRTLLRRKCPVCAGKKTLAGFNDLETWCKKHGKNDLLDEWDYEKNGFPPSDVSPANSKKVWWKCSLGHTWQATIGSRTSNKRPCGCPFCSNPPKKVLQGFNDFETWCKNHGKEKLLQEWNHDRNNGVLPKDITYGSGTRVWWKCAKGHEWFVSPGNRVQGTECPICARTQTSFPEQAIAFYAAKAYRIIQRFRLKGLEVDVLLEDFKIGIEYDGKFFHKKEDEKREQEKDEFFQKNGYRLIHIKETEGQQGFAGNILFFVPGKSNYLDAGFNEMLRSLFSYLETLTKVRFAETIDIVRDEAEIRSHYLSALKSGSVSTVFPELAPEWDIEKNDGMTPDLFSAHSHTKVWWKCRHGHSWQASIASRSRGLGCPYCAGQKTIPGQNDLESWCNKNMPQLLLEWDYGKNEMKPSEISPFSNQKVWWKCAQGHEWEAVVANRVHGNRCPFCHTGQNGRRVSFAQWCKENGKENLIAEWNAEKNKPLTPEVVSKGSHKKVWWKCANGHEWQAEIKSRTYNHGCPFCSDTNKKAVMGVNDLVTWCRKNGREDLLAEWDYEANDDQIPEMFTPGSHARINWVCSNGHKWSAVIKERTKPNGNKCPHCKQRK